MTGGRYVIDSEATILDNMIIIFHFATQLILQSVLMAGWSVRCYDDGGGKGRFEEGWQFIELRARHHRGGSCTFISFH